MTRAIFIILCLLSLQAKAEIPFAAWEYQDQMSESAWNTFGPRAPIATLAAQIHQESAWKCDAVSWAGAKGCAQFMNMTAADMAKRYPQFCAPADPGEPEWDFTCRDLYLKSQITASKSAGTDECSDWAFGFKGYNGGLTWVKRDRKLAADNGRNPDNWREVNLFNSGRKPSAYKENKEYPERIFKLERLYASWGDGLGCHDRGLLVTHGGGFSP